MSKSVQKYCYKVKKVHRKSLYKVGVLKIVANDSSINALIPSLSKKYLSRILSDGEGKKEAIIQLSWTNQKGFLTEMAKNSFMVGWPIVAARVASTNKGFVPLRSLNQPCNL